jgi:predicted phage terminase large subunit-like protein
MAITTPAPLSALRLLGEEEPLPTWLDDPGTMAARLTANMVERWVMAPHLEYVSNKIAEMRERPLRLIVAWPPRHGKSELLSHWVPIWVLSRWPDKRIVLASYEANFAATWGRKARNSIAEHNADLPITVSRSSMAAADWEVSGGIGGMHTSGVGGAITGRGADLLIIDDPIKNAQESLSELQRERAWDWWRSTARTRLEPNGSIIVIMTRWHEDDLAGRLIADGTEDWEELVFPALAEPEDLLNRAEGEPLWPERYDAPALDIQRVGSGPYWWNAMYQQRPTAEEGGIIKLAWWEYYRERPGFSRVVQAWDTAFKTGRENDYSVCVTMGQSGDAFYVLDVWRGRVEYPELQRMAQVLFDRHHPRVVLVEDKASGQSLSQTLKRETSLPVVPVMPRGDKATRAYAVTGYIEAGRVRLPEEAEWVSDFLIESSAFPTGAHDDQVDAFVYALQHLTEATVGKAWV